MLLLLCWCQLRHINHASINILTSIIGGRRWRGIWLIRWSPTGYWRSLQLMCCVMWRSGWLLTNRGQLVWINEWIIQWRRHIYNRWWKLIALWVTVLVIRAPVIMRSVLWRAGWLLKNQGQLRWIDDWIIQWGRKDITSNDNLLLFEWQSYQLKHWSYWGVVRCLPWLLPVPILWHVPKPLKLGMMNTIWVCGDLVCVLLCLLMSIKRWEPTFWHNNCIYVWVYVPGIKIDYNIFFSILS